MTPGVHALVCADGRGRPVTAVAAVTAGGLYLHTAAGKLVIDGAVVVTGRTKAVPGAAAAVGLAAARVAAVKGLRGVLSRALAGGCLPPVQQVLPLLWGLCGGAGG